MIFDYWLVGEENGVNVIDVLCVVFGENLLVIIIIGNIDFLFISCMIGKKIFVMYKLIDFDVLLVRIEEELFWLV